MKIDKTAGEQMRKTRKEVGVYRKAQSEKVKDNFVATSNEYFLVPYLT